MGAVYNLVPENGYRLNSNASDWSVISGSGTITANTDVVLYPNSGSLQFTPSGTATVSIASQEIPSVDLGWTLRGSVWAFSPAPRAITITVSRTVGDTATTSNTVNILASRWTLISVDGPMTFPNQTNTARLQLQTDGLTYFAWPVLSVPDTAARNLFASESYVVLPDFIKDADDQFTGPTAPLYRFMEVLCTEASVLYDEWSLARYLPPDTYFPFDDDSLSHLVHPQVCPTDRLPWLGQFVGVKVQAKETSYTSWGTLEEGLESWAEWHIEPDEVVAVGNFSGVTQWAEIENYSPASSGLDTSMRWQVSSGAWGMHAGTNAALISTAQQLLTGTKAVTVTPNHLGNPWVIVVRTVAAESPDGIAFNGSSASLLEALFKAAPVGYEIVHIASL